MAQTMPVIFAVEFMGLPHTHQSQIIQAHLKFYQWSRQPCKPAHCAINLIISNKLFKQLVVHSQVIINNKKMSFLVNMKIKSHAFALGNPAICVALMSHGTLNYLPQIIKCYCFSHWCHVTSVISEKVKNNPAKNVILRMTSYLLLYLSPLLKTSLYLLSKAL